MDNYPFIFIGQDNAKEITTLSLVTSSSVSSNVALPFPTTQAGDVIIAAIWASNSVNLAPTGGTGWLRLNGRSATNVFVQVYAKICDGTESGNIWAASLTQQKGYTLLRGDQAITALEPRDRYRFLSSSAITNATLQEEFTDLSETAGVFLCAFSGGATNFTTTAFSPTADNNWNQNRIWLYTLLADKDEAFPTIDADMADVGSTNIVLLSSLQFWAGTAPATSLTQIDSVKQTSGTSTNVTLPTCQDGDLIVVFQKLTGIGTSDTYDSQEDYDKLVDGFRGYALGDMSGHQYGIFVKIATTADSGRTATLRTNTTTTVNEYIAYSFRANAPIVSFAKSNGDYGNTSETAQSTDLDFSTGNPVGRVLIQTQDGDYGDTAALTLAFYGSTGVVSPRTWTSSNAEDVEDEIDTSFYIKYRFMASSATDVTVDMDDEGNNSLGGVNLRLDVEA